MINILRHIILLLLWFNVGLKANAQHLEQMPCDIQNIAFQAGEKLVYKVYYNWQFIWIPAGEVSFEIFETDSTYQMLTLGSTYSSYDPFFKVRDRFESTIDKETMLPKTFVRDIAEGNYMRYDSVVFDQINQTATEYIGKHKSKIKRLDFSFESCVQDMVSIMYYLRNIDDQYIKQNNALPISVFFDKELFNLNVNVLARDEIKVKGLGTQEVIHISPQLVTGDVFKEGNEMNIYVSANQSKVPLLIESAVSVGSVKAILVDSEYTIDKLF